MTEHNLKTINPYFTDVWNWEKTFEIRKNDRNFKKGDLLKLREYEPCWDKENDCLVSGGGYTGRVIYAEIDYILPENTFEGLAQGYCVLGINILDMFADGDLEP